MCDTLRTSYEGWDITVRCLRFRAGSGERNGNSGSFTASGRAVLKNAAEERAWTDSRPQVVTLGGRIFDTTASCAQVLLAELTVLIDALKRVNGAPGKPQRQLAPAKPHAITR